MPNSNILRIQRIQNKYVLKIFNLELEILANKYNTHTSIIKTLDLFHGTRNTPSE